MQIYWLGSMFFRSLLFWNCLTEVIRSVIRVFNPKRVWATSRHKKGIILMHCCHLHLQQAKKQIQACSSRHPHKIEEMFKYSDPFSTNHNYKTKKTNQINKKKIQKWNKRGRKPSIWSLLTKQLHDGICPTHIISYPPLEHERLAAPQSFQLSESSEH